MRRVNCLVLGGFARVASGQACHLRVDGLEAGDPRGNSPAQYRRLVWAEMFSRFLRYLRRLESAWQRAFGNDISTPRARRVARIHLNWVDLGILRKWWTNFDRVADDVYRSNQPCPKRLAAYKERGIKSVLNLRGATPFSFYLFEEEACQKLGLNLVSLHFSPNKLPSRETILELEKLFKTMEKPLVLHCKSGADRAGFVSALYLLLIKGAKIEEAQRQLSFRYLHIRKSSKGILDYCLEKYRDANEKSPIGFRDWVLSVYDPDMILQEFRQSRGRGSKARS